MNKERKKHVCLILYSFISHLKELDFALEICKDGSIVFVDNNSDKYKVNAEVFQELYDKGLEDEQKNEF